MPKSAYLQIRVSPEDLKRIEAVADAEFLGKSTWARRAILKAVEKWEERLAQPRN